MNSDKIQQEKKKLISDLEEVYMHNSTLQQIVQD